MPSAEARLVFRTADPSFGDGECATTVAAVRDWDRVLAITEREVATSPVWRALKGAGAEVPAEVLEALRARALWRELRMQRLAQRLQQTVRVFAERGIPVMLLKGAAYAALFDPTLRTRAMTDIDLLVRREDVARARDAVIAAGWPQTEDPRLHELLKDGHHLPDFLDPQDPSVRLELHVALMPSDQPFAFSEAEFWREARPAAAPLEGALVPAPEQFLVHASMHFAWQHSLAFGAWRTLRVVSALTTLPAFDWDRFVELARAARAATCAYWTLRLARRLGGIAVRDDVLASLAPPTPEFVRAALERHFIAAIAVGEGPRSPSVKLTRLLWLAALRPKWSGHANPGRFDPENKWAVAYGTASTETLPARLTRHLRGVGRWVSFVFRTLGGSARADG